MKKVRAAGPKKSYSLASSTDNISGTAAIAEMWKNTFSNLLNEQNTPDAGEIFSAEASSNSQEIGCNQYLNCRGEASPHRDLSSPHRDLASPYRDLDVHSSKFEPWMMKRSRASQHE